MKVHKKNILITSAVFTIVLLFTGAVKAADFNFLIGTWTLTITGKQFGEPFESHPTWVFTEASETAAIGNNIKDNDLLVTWDSTRGQYRQQNPGSDLIYYFSAFNNKIRGEIKDTSFNSIFSDMTFEGVKDVSNEPEVNTYFYDNDSDGYGDPNASYDAASQPAGYVTDNTDCNDYDSSIHPGATEIEGEDRKSVV